MWLIVWLLVLVVIAYQAVDVWQTYLLLELGAAEANPLLAYLMSLIGDLPGLVLFKAFFVAALIAGLILKQFKEDKSHVRNVRRSTNLEQRKA